MPATGCAQRHTGVQQRQGRGAHRAHRRRAVGAESLGHLTDRVRELLAAGQHRHEGALGEEAVPDLATLGAAHAAGLTGRVRREVVVVHVALVRHRRQRVDLLLHLEHVQRGDTQDLGLAALEDRRAVNARDDLHLGVERTDVGQAASVDAHAVGEDAAAHDLLRDRLVGGGELERRDGLELAGLDGARAARPLTRVLQRVVGVLTLDLVGDLVDRHELVVGAAARRSRRSPGCTAGRPGTP